MTKQFYRVFSYDVWGNEEDGWEVNDVWKTWHTVELSPECTDDEVIEELIACGYADPELKKSGIETDGDDQYITVELPNGYPFCELRMEPI